MSQDPRSESDRRPMLVIASRREVQIASVFALGLALLLPAIQWFGYVVELAKASEELEVPEAWRLIYNFEDPEFIEGMVSGIKLASKFWKSVFWLSAFEMIGLFVALLVALLLWRSALWHEQHSIGYFLLSGLPACWQRSKTDPPQRSEIDPPLPGL